ncbi:Ig-like domain-containing protein [Anaerocolumna sp. AGMB13025]|uniref:Ig-like domain-containing protein n=1 Tax=Anaerocolumna sp. AGMB13025 TaxID=3039116 RepID=UPI00241D2912|nr:Ig-like domain-containing protein [Anaerocolumna sp. AGMB13025]WFR56303.1 Ig-like domain-containing protein [Anaerocolumna sp. AGMB13025]
MKNGKRGVRNWLVKLMVGIVFVSSVLTNPGTKAEAAVKAPVISKAVDVVVGGTYRFEINNRVKNSTCQWTSNNKKVATVTNKGVVTGVKNGTADITCKVETSKETVYLLSKVTVRDLAEAVKISNKVTTLNLGQKYDLNRTLTPADSNDRTIWSSSNTGIAKPDSLGKITALKVGKVKITATTLSGKSDTVTIQVVDKEGTVKNQTEINRMLNSGAAQITLKTKAAININIPEGNYQKQTLIVDAPNADVTNKGIFKAVEIRHIKANTWYEEAVGNIISVSAPTSRVAVIDGACASIHVTSGTENFTLLNNGAVDELRIDAAAHVNISGNPTASTPVYANTAGATITSSIPLTLACTEKINLVILPGAEATIIQVESEDLIPVITGSSPIKVIVGTGENARSIEVEPTNASVNDTVGGTPSTPNEPSNPGTPSNPGMPTNPENPAVGSIAGRVTVVSGSSISVSEDATAEAITLEPLAGANVRILKYVGDAASAIEAINTNPDVVVPCVTGDGYFTANNLETGNYIVVFAKQDYKVIVKLATVEENSESVVNATMDKLEPGEDITKGIANGLIINSLTGMAVDENLEFTLQIYSGFDNTTDLISTETIEGGVYSVQLAEGHYTFKLTDTRTPEDGVTYKTATHNVIVLGGTLFTNQDISLTLLED